MSPNIRRPLQPDEVEPLRRLGALVRTLRQQAGVSCAYVSRATLFTVRHLERIEQGARRTRQSTLEAVVDALLEVRPDLGGRDDLVQQLVHEAGPALAPESAYADKTAARRRGKAQRIADRRAMYAD